MYNIQTLSIKIKFYEFLTTNTLRVIMIFIDQHLIIQCNTRTLINDTLKKNLLIIIESIANRIRVFSENFSIGLLFFELQWKQKLNFIENQY